MYSLQYEWSSADRFFELIGYPPNFKKNNGFNKGTISSNYVTRNTDQPASNSFTDEQYKRLMALISEKSGSSSMPVNIVVGHPNATKAVVTHVGSLRPTDQIVIHDVIGVPGYEFRLLFVHKLSKDNKFRVIFDEDFCVIQDSLQRTQVGTSNESNGLISSSVLFGKSPYELVFKIEPNLSHLKTFGCLCFSTVLNDSDKFSSSNEDESKSSEPNDDGRDKETEKTEAVGNVEENAILDENDNEYEGDDSFYQEFNEMFQTPDVIPDSQSDFNPRRSSRKTNMPKKLSDFKTDTRVKYSIDKQVNYSNLSLENFNFSTSLNKIVKPKTFDEASKDARWVVAMNLEMEALNMNGTWIITELPIGRKPIGSKWVYKVKYKSTSEVERFKASFAIQITANPVFHERTKHFEIELYFLREKVLADVVKTIKVKFVDNTADIFTKGLSVCDHNKFGDNQGMKDLYIINLMGNIKNKKLNFV
uniref:Putative reverse transcriptase, RNA-dependent DNA polymerase, Gag-polypeptide of LTR copia-type n=1 Tax=Tanacetum cinerariifolium TaxID=118510 RepID=A0A6L2M501_TANCI|nr:putative reverse transcriptase, RNA-dependent DNA polymerase, Gag-polypeptide of LTR copia-type [Tanacetum cinerariifolium]